MKRSKLEDIATCLIYDELLTDENWGPIQKLGSIIFMSREKQL